MQAELTAVLLGKDARPHWQQLEQLPYLNAVVTEGPRMSYGVTHRLQRIPPDLALQYREWNIPIGTPVVMTSVLLHNNEDNFPNPRKFEPQRWLQSPGNRLKRYLVAFSRGSRQCVGTK